MENRKIAIVFTGIIEDYYLDEFLDIYKDCNYTKIVSTWDYIDEKIIQKLKTNNYMVVQSTFPENIRKKSVNYQIWSTKIGIEFAKQNGFTHILKLRSDMPVNKINEFIGIYDSIYEEDKIIYVKHSFIGTSVPSFLCDFGLFGNIKTMEFVYSKEIYQEENDDRFPELFLQYITFNINDIEEENFKKIKDKVIFSAMYLMNENIDFYFIKRNYENIRDIVKKHHINSITNGYKIYYM